VDVASGLVCGLCVVVHYLDCVATWMGRWLLPVMVLAIVSGVFEAVRDLRDLRGDPKLTEREDLCLTVIGIAAFLLVFVPAYVLGAAAAIRHW